MKVVILSEAERSLVLRSFGFAQDDTLLSDDRPPNWSEATVIGAKGAKNSPQ
jgi:hypothetical protein